MDDSLKSLFKSLCSNLEESDYSLNMAEISAVPGKNKSVKRALSEDYSEDMITEKKLIMDSPKLTAVKHEYGIRASYQSQVNSNHSYLTPNIVNLINMTIDNVV